MLRTSIEPPIVKSGGKVKNPADEVILAKSALVFHDSKDFGFSDCVLDLDACPGYFSVGRLLLLGKFLSIRFLRRLYHGDVIGTVLLVSGILLKDAFIREGIHFIGDTLVVHLSLHSEACKKDKSCHTGDYRVIDGMFLLFAAIVLLLKIRVVRSRNFAPCPVMNEFMYDSVAATLVKKFPESHDIGSRKHPCIPGCIAEYLRQSVDSLPALLLAHAKTSRMRAGDTQSSTSHNADISNHQSSIFQDIAVFGHEEAKLARAYQYAYHCPRGHAIYIPYVARQYPAKTG